MIDLSYEGAVRYLDDHIGMGMEPGLERIDGLLDLMGHPERGYPVIHIAGTNGKTSVARMATMLLVAHGLNTGTFTSPHLQRIEERIAVNGVPASSEEFAQAVVDVKAFADLYEDGHGPSLTYFELTAAMAFAWFADQAVNAAVIEVGLGGRLDATNAVEADVSVLTGVGLEHMEYLGNTLQEIAGEKLAIVEEGSVLVTAPLRDDITKQARRKAAEKGATIHEYGQDFQVADATRAIGGWRIDVDGVYRPYEGLYLPLHGRHQTINLAVAIAAAEGLLGRELHPDAVIDGTAVITAPGRMEPVGQDPLVMLDGAHNPDGFAALSAALSEEFPTTRWVLVMGAMADKDLRGMLPPLADRLSAVIATSVESPRALRPGDLAGTVRSLVDLPVEAIEDRAEALDHAKSLAADGQGVLVAGSLYLVGAARSILLGDPAPQRNER